MRAVYYARVSTEEEKQVSALSKQCEEAQHQILEQGWDLVDSYVDEGKSGTSSKKRDEYNRLYEDLESDLFDIIVIKSQDRLMRNVKDWYMFIDKMVKNGKKLYIYIDNKFYQSDDALITGIKAILAEEYSRELSKKINNSNKRRQATASSIITNGKLWGYTQKDGELTINEEEAKVVRRIFELYVSGLGCRGIRKQLTIDGLLTRNSTEFAETTIKRMIKNEKYKGTVIFNKTHKDFDTKKVVENPKSEWIIHENRIPSIIELDVWEEANRIMSSRAIERVDQKVGYNKARHPLGGKIICGECGKVYYRSHIKNSNDKKTFKYIWQCSTYVQKGRLNPWKKAKVKYDSPQDWVGCDGINIEDSQIEYLMSDIANNFSIDFQYIIDKMMDYINQMYSETQSNNNIEEIHKDIDKIEKQKSFLLDKFMEGILEDSQYTQKNNELNIKLDALNDKLDSVNLTANSMVEIENRLERIKDSLESSIINDEKSAFIMDRIKQITIYKDRLEVDVDAIGEVIASIGEDKSLNVITTRAHGYTDAGLTEEEAEEIIDYYCNTRFV